MFGIKAPNSAIVNTKRSKRSPPFFFDAHFNPFKDLMLFSLIIWKVFKHSYELSLRIWSLNEKGPSFTLGPSVFGAAGRN
jgi:hypothetical protein